VKYAAIISAIIVVCFAHVASAANAQDCPKGVDPTYCAVANATGGKVIVTTPDNLQKDFEKQVLGEIQSRAVHTDVISSTSAAQLKEEKLQQNLFWLQAIILLCSTMLCGIATVCFLQKKHLILGGLSYGVFMVNPVISLRLNMMLWSDYSGSAVVQVNDIVASMVLLSIVILASFVARSVFSKERASSTKLTFAIASFLIVALQTLCVQGYFTPHIS
jgi:hypothetical protein